LKDSLNQCFDRMSDRLKAGVDWFPFPALIVTVIVMIIVAKSMPGVNPKTGLRAQLLKYHPAESSLNSIFISVRMIDDMLLVTSGSNHKFLIPAVNPTKEQLGGLSEYLRNEASHRITSLVLLHRHIAEQTSVTIGADERLSFENMRGVITALADAGINSYAFETMVVSSNDAHNSKETQGH
jgi:hypothetical protein